MSAQCLSSIKKIEYARKALGTTFGVFLRYPSTREKISSYANSGEGRSGWSLDMSIKFSVFVSVMGENGESQRVFLATNSYEIFSKKIDV